MRTNAVRKQEAGQSFDWLEIAIQRQNAAHAASDKGPEVSAIRFLGVFGTKRPSQESNLKRGMILETAATEADPEGHSGGVPDVPPPSEGGEKDLRGAWARVTGSWPLGHRHCHHTRAPLHTTSCGEFQGLERSVLPGGG